MNQAWTAMLPAFIRRRLDGRQELQRIVSNSGWLFADKIIRMGGGLLVGAWVARYLGPEGFGVFNFAIAFAALFGAVASLGLDGIVVRDLVREFEKKNEILSSAFILKLCGGGIAFCVSLGAIFLMRPSDSLTHWLVGIVAAGMIFQSFDTIDLWFQSQVKSKYTVIAKNTAFVVLAAVKVALILNKAPLTAFAWAALAEIILGSAGLIMIFYRQNLDPVWCPKIDTARYLIKESWPCILSGLAIMVYMRIDQIMLAQLSGNHSVGLYSAALSFSEIWYFIPIIIVSSVMPSITQARQESREKYLRRMQQLFNNLVKVAYVIALPMSLLSTYVVTFVYGSTYEEAGTMLAIHIWSAVFVFIGVGMSPWLLNEGLLKYSAVQTIAGAIVNVLLNLLLIPRFGGVGAAIATLISQMVASFVSNLFTPMLRIVFRMQLRALTRPV